MNSLMVSLWMDRSEPRDRAIKLCGWNFEQDLEHFVNCLYENKVKQQHIFSISFFIISYFIVLYHILFYCYLFHLFAF